MASTLHISISAEEVATLGPLSISNSMLTSLLVTAILVLFAVAANRSLRTSGRPSRFQTLIEVIVEGLRGLVTGIAGEGKNAAVFGPIIVSFFLFILLNNWVGLLPGVGTIGISEPLHLAQVEQLQATETSIQSDDGSQTSTEIAAVSTDEPGSEEKPHTTFIPLFRAATADLNTTIALALISVILTQIFGLTNLGLSYLSKFFNFKNPLVFLLGLLELVLELAKIISFSFRLFGNIFAGEVLIAVIMFLVPIIVPMPFYGLELFVGLIQALVFSLLSLVFFNMATVGHGEEH